MIQQRLSDLRDYILKHNTYLTAGYSDVYQDTESGIIKNRERVVFPADNMGNYFYLRLPNNYSFTENAFYRQSDETKGYGLTSQCVLVCYMKDAVPDTLLANLVNTVELFAAEDIRLISATANAETVIGAELAKGSNRDSVRNTVTTALKNLGKNTAIVSLTFSLTDGILFQELNCLPNPCATC